METATGISEPTPCEKMKAQARKLMDMSVEFRAEIYKFDLMCRECEDCLANGKNKEAKP